ncbi:protein kinase [Xylaria bambusicola]|uniref:protein kinase n=1 Tax=Xylaria bambusicola TaxID=326684 RepID=UPI0020082C11|nr:protein kinase [Xylaria bambusicola]KAI0517362.1 protein kinase [Xylaria bambusicola]
MWWDSSLIEATVTRQFVCSHLIPEEIDRLDRPLGFGDGLTDGTYWEWIEKAKRIFLILADLGVPDQIFGIIDDSWDDDDLPIALDQVARLSLTPGKDDKLAKKFYTRQFHYLVRYIDKGKHVVYQDDDLIPVVVDKRAGLTTNAAVERVELPNKPGEAFLRRRFSIGTGPVNISMENFWFEINSIKNLQSGHLASYYGSYVHQGCAYVIFTNPTDFSLKSLLSTTPGPWKSLAKQERRQLMMNWIHCLTDTLCYIHRQRRSHGNIKPSTILFRSDNLIFYNSMSRLCGEAAVSASEKSVFDRESYDFAAPEQWYRPSVNSHRKTLLAQSSASTSSDSTTFSISRGGSETSSNASSALHTPNPLLDPQAADIFSLGCVILELIGLLMKRTAKAFASHRAAKHKLAGRGGAVPDSSFHKNLNQVESWMTGLAKDAAKKDDLIFRGIGPMLHIVARMLSVLPSERPTAQEVEQAMYKILTEKCQIAEPHCVHQYGELSLGLGNLTINQPNGNFSIATRPSRPSSSISGHRRSGSNLNNLDRGRATSSTGSSSSGHLLLQDIRSSHTRPDWQTHSHSNSPTYAVGTY